MFICRTEYVLCCDYRSDDFEAAPVSLRQRRWMAAPESKSLTSLHEDPDINVLKKETENVCMI